MLYVFLICNRHNQTIIGGLLYYKLTQNNEVQFDLNKLIAFTKYSHIGDFGEHEASGLALVQVVVDGMISTE